MSMAFTYEIRGNDERTPVLIVVIVNTVVIPSATRAEVALIIQIDIRLLILIISKLTS